jgi:ubiquinone/menaquinone biosynthesis C-methylase UbiE
MMGDVPNTVDRPHPLFARFYQRAAARADARGGRELRRELVAGLSGRVIEPGSGPGLNFAHYPLQVSEVVAVEPEPRLRAAAVKRAASLALAVRVVPGRIESLPAADHDFDAAVLSVVLCSVEDTSAALAELHRVLRPGGQLRFFEHVRAPKPTLARLQRAADATVWPRLAGGCHTSRDSLSLIRAARFNVEHSRLFPFRPDLPSLIASWWILGAATHS